MKKQLGNLFDGMLPLYKLQMYWLIWMQYERKNYYS